MARALSVLSLLLVFGLVAPSSAANVWVAAATPTQPETAAAMGTSGEIEQIGHEPLMNRGMNSSPQSTATTRISGAAPTVATKARHTAA